ncbi:VQ motif-containing protein 22-like [Juglans microcarpa x Juglans regia]|uniref:VQ motif-containing protein 22-like n=1 Tax=Juglans microcarpa x Juglans regia TaxID=2249226 RepID=UPI001B7E9B65|nr:VQ motif-containing protein 22-like [Juglans microcarpa x Juglans regia]
MDNTFRPSSSGWLPFYDRAAIDGQPVLSHGVQISDATVVTTSVETDTNISSPSGNPSKPIRRRSRASKRTPTTLLNANTSNFRALVQQFTGCPSTAISFGNQRGPVNLNFGKANQENQRMVTSVMAPFGTNYHYHQQSQSQQPVLADDHQYQRHNQQQQLLLQEQQSMYSFGNNISSDVFVSSASSNAPRPNVETADGFAAMDDNVFFHELTMDSFSSDVKNEGFF